MTHDYEIISLSTYPAIICKCSRWSHAFTRQPGDTMQSVKAKLEEAHKEHAEQVAEEVTP